MTSVLSLSRPKPQVRLTEIEFCAWIAQATPGDVLEYHRGALAIDRMRGMSLLDARDCARLNLLADRTFAAAEQGLVHLVQCRLGPDDFSYLAIARPRPRNAGDALSVLLLAEAA